MSDWTFELANSSDLTRIAELTQARGRSLQLALNKAGAFNCQMPLDDPIAMEAREITTCVIVSFQNEVIWSGPIWNINESLSATDSSVQFTAIGWLQTLDKRVIRPSWGTPLTYTDTDAGEIATNLVMRTNEDAFTAGAPNYVFPGAWEITQPRNRTYQPWSGILASITELTEIESGFDIEVHPETRELNIFTRLQEDRGVHFEIGTNVQNISRQSDSGRVSNYVNAYSTTGVRTVTDPFAANEFGLFEESYSLSDVVNADILGAFAAAEITIKARPLVISSFQPMPHSPSRPDDPRPFRDYNIGDIVYLTARRGRLVVDRQASRLFSYTINFNDHGSEQVTGVQVTAA